jgi:hypothetical protein
VAGTVTNSAAVAAYTPNEFIPLATSPGRIGVAVALAALLPLIYAVMTGPGAVTIALLALTVIPSALAKLVFGAGFPWGIVLALNGVYAVTAWAVYLAITWKAEHRPFLVPR